MKKISLAVILLTAVYIVNAQTPIIEKSAATKDPPASISSSFAATHRDVTVMSWEAMNDWWCAIYKNDSNRLIHVYYNTQPWYLERNDNFMEALPVINTFVPEDVITSAINNYGTDLYGITALKTADNNNELTYQVCLVKNGVSDRVLMNTKAVAFSNTNKLRTK